jgi:hypothetical protein
VRLGRDRRVATARTGGRLGLWVVQAACSGSGWLEGDGVAERFELALASAGAVSSACAASRVLARGPGPGHERRGSRRRAGRGGSRRSLWVRLGRLIYRKAKKTIEPVFRHTKYNAGINLFHRPGRVKIRTEWRLLMMSRNLRKLYRYQLAATDA